MVTAKKCKHKWKDDFMAVMIMEYEEEEEDDDDDGQEDEERNLNVMIC